MVFSEIEVSHFRGIKHMHLHNLKQINLFLGKNNCGKSTVLDAVFLLMGMSNPVLSFRINQFRDYSRFKEDDLYLNFYNLDSSNPIYIKGSVNGEVQRELRISATATQLKKLDSKEDIPYNSLSNSEDVKRGLLFKFGFFNGKEIEYRTSSIFFSVKNNDIINYKRDNNYKESLTSIYINSRFEFNIAIENLIKIKEEKQDKFIINVLRQIEPKIKSVDVLDSAVYVDIGLERLIPINLLGDGIRKLLAIVTAMYTCRDGAIFIDEIDNGMHFSSLSSLWKSVIITAKELNVQVFATTHSIESLQMLSKLLEEDDKGYRESVNCYTLRHGTDDDVKAYDYPYDKFQFAINQEIEIR